MVIITETPNVAWTCVLAPTILYPSASVRSVRGTRPGPFTSASVFSFDEKGIGSLKHTQVISLRAAGDNTCTTARAYHKNPVSLITLFCFQLESRWLQCKPIQQIWSCTWPDVTANQLKRHSTTRASDPAPNISTATSSTPRSRCRPYSIHSRRRLQTSSPPPVNVSPVVAVNISDDES